MWLKDLLPEKLPGARIMTFEYNAGAVANTSPYGVRANAVKLIRALRDKREDDVSEGSRASATRPPTWLTAVTTGIGCKRATSFNRLHWA